MEKRPLGTSGLDVSVICLGTMTWGQQNTEADAHAQMDLAWELGINFMDAAELYPVPPKAETQGRTEACIGTWLAARKNREQVILATKIAGVSERLQWIRGGKTRFDRQNIETALHDSLKRLQTDYIDLYQLHWPDRETNNFGQLGYKHDPNDQPIPLEETLGILQEFVQAGKIRHVAVSNETPWGVMTALDLAKTKELPRIQSIQNPYSLLNRSYEIGLAECSIREHCGLLAYSPLGMGILTGKYLDGARPANARLTLFGYFDRYVNPDTELATKEYVRIANEAGISPTHLALAFVNRQDFVTSNIIGATTLEQLRENIASAEIKLSEDTLAAIEAVHVQHPNPAP